MARCSRFMLLAAAGLAFGCKDESEILLAEPPAVWSASTPEGDASGAPVVEARAPAPVCAHAADARRVARARYGDVRSVRILASPSSLTVTWEELWIADIGDSHQVGAVASGPRRAGASLVTTAFPARAYAAAAFTSIAPTTVRGSVGAVVYGVAGEPSFEAHAVPPPRLGGEEVFSASGPTPAVSFAPDLSVQEPLAAALDSSLLVAAVVDMPCIPYRSCPADFDWGAVAGLPKKLRSVSLDGVPESSVLFTGGADFPKKPFAPAIASGEGRALVAFRVEDHLLGVWIDRRGRPGSAPFEIAAAPDIGAPAVALEGRTALVSWAERERGSDAYRLRIARIDGNVVVHEAGIETDGASAFAPALALLPNGAAIAWMEGDDTKRGRIRLGTLPTAVLSSGGPAIVAPADVMGLGPADGNRRDPELAAVGGDLYAVHTDFTTVRDGDVWIDTLTCR